MDFLKTSRKRKTSRMVAKVNHRIWTNVCSCLDLEERHKRLRLGGKRRT
jgi:hypothetical protein